jgi:hypothetical protein
MWLLYSPPVPFVRCDSVHNLPCHADGVLGLWLSGEVEFVSEWLVDIRHHSPHACLPIFVDCELPDEIACLADGHAETLEVALEKARDWRPSASRLQGATPSPALALVRYLYLRPLAAMSPVRDAAAHQAYRFPLLEAFVDGETPEILLDTLRARGWIEQAHLVDRLRCCERCRSVHLNYLDVCPGCQSLNIEEKIYIHCFTCSHLAPQEKFLRQGALACPNCQARLRHVGVDYNRPLEQMYCRDCAMAFTDAKVVARCLGCGCEHDPERLSVLNVGTYALTDSGRQAARLGIEGGATVPMSLQPRGMTTEAFIELADWMMSLARRHEGTELVLIGLSFYADRELELLLGEGGTHRLAQVFLGRLRELMRDTDVMVQVNDHLLWMMLPQTNQAGGEVMLEKISRLAGKVVQENCSGIEVRGAVYAPEDIPDSLPVEQFLHSIDGRLQRGLPC